MGHSKLNQSKTVKFTSLILMKFGVLVFDHKFPTTFYVNLIFTSRDRGHQTLWEYIWEYISCGKMGDDKLAKRADAWKVEGKWRQRTLNMRLH